jgi:SAM-dependent methyltransferase
MLLAPGSRAGTIFAPTGHRSSGQEMRTRSYDNGLSSHSFAAPSAGMRALIELFVSPGAHCLEVTCAEATTAASWLHEHGHSCVDVDMSRRSMLSFDDESFDAAIMIEALEHLTAPVQAASEVRRVLKPGGVLLVTAWNVSYWRHRFDRCLRDRGERSIAFNPASLRHLLLQAGFNLVGVEGHDGAIVRDLPLARRFWKGRTSGLYRVTERLFPTLLGSRVGAFAIKA